MGKYDAIFNMQRPLSKKHKRMSNLNRAAQFSAFAALKGYDDGNETKNDVEIITDIENVQDIQDV